MPDPSRERCLGRRWRGGGVHRTLRRAVFAGARCVLLVAPEVATAAERERQCWRGPTGGSALGGVGVAWEWCGMQAPLPAAEDGKVWLRTENGKYVQMMPDTRRKVLANQSTYVEQFCPHGLPLPEAHEDEIERAKVAAMKAEFMASEVERTAAVDVRLLANLQPVEAKVARFGAQSCALADAVALRAIPPLADSDLRNASNLKGAIAVVERGGNAFVDKALRVQAAGAVGVIVINTDDAPYVPLGNPAGGDEGVRIPVVCVRRREAPRFRNPANVTLEFGDVAAAAASGSNSGSAGGGVDGDTPEESESESESEYEDEGTAEVIPPDPTAVSFLVTVPEGQRAGSRMVVTAPDGRSVAIDVPQGAVAGQQLQINLPAAVAGAVQDDDGGSYDESDEYEGEGEYSDEYTDEELLDDEGDEDSEIELEGAGVGFSPQNERRVPEEEQDEATTTSRDEPADQHHAEAGEEPPAPLTFLVTLPAGVESGQQIRVQAPDGRSAVITVPEGVSAGQQLRVQLPPAAPEPAVRAEAGATPQSDVAPSSSTTPTPSIEPAARAPEPEPQPQATHAPATAPAPAPVPEPAADTGTTLAVVVPEGVSAGQQLRVQAPDGRQALITVPEGVQPGQQLRLTLPPATPTPRPQLQPAAAPPTQRDTPRPGVGWGKTQLAPSGTNAPRPADTASSSARDDRRYGDRVLSTDDPDAPERERQTDRDMASRSAVSSLPPAEAGKHWYRDTDGELRQLTVAQRRIAMGNLQVSPSPSPFPSLSLSLARSLPPSLPLPLVRSAMLSVALSLCHVLLLCLRVSGARYAGSLSG